MTTSEPNLYSALRPELVDPLVEQGVELFATAKHFPQGVPRYNILGWLFATCAEAGHRLSMLERDEIVARVQARVSPVMDFGRHVLTASTLRELLAKLPENMPVLYQRIEDVYFDKHKWKATLLPWGQMHEASPQDVEAITRDKPEHCDLVQRDGKTFVRELSAYVPAFSAYLVTDEQGRQAVCINAHY